jgi:DNA-binding CsgD family transcriptional regulator
MTPFPLPKLVQAMGRTGRVSAGLVRVDPPDLVQATPELEALLSSISLPRHGPVPARWLLNTKDVEAKGMEAEYADLSGTPSAWTVVFVRPAPEVHLRILVDQISRRHQLSPSEQREVEHLARGLSIKESAQQLEIAPETVRVRRKRVYRKMKLSGHEALLALLCLEAVAPTRGRTSHDR